MLDQHVVTDGKRRQRVYLLVVVLHLELFGTAGSLLEIVCRFLPLRSKRPTVSR
jgi:hypothetical protein